MRFITLNDKTSHNSIMIKVGNTSYFSGLYTMKRHINRFSFPIWVYLEWSLVIVVQFLFRHIFWSSLPICSYTYKNYMWKIWLQLINHKTDLKKVEYLNFRVVFQFIIFISKNILLLIKVYRTFVNHTHISYK